MCSGRYVVGEALERRVLFSGGGGRGASVAVPVEAPFIRSVKAARQIVGTDDRLSVVAVAKGARGELTYSWTLEGGTDGAEAEIQTGGAKTTRVRFSAAGDYVFGVVVSAGGQTSSGNVSVHVVSRASSIAITPADPRVGKDDSLVLSAHVFDQFGQPMAQGSALKWKRVSGPGRVDRHGEFIPVGKTGQATISASTGKATATAVVQVLDTKPPPVIIQVATATETNVDGTSVGLTIVADDYGKNDLVYTWSMIQGPGGASPQFQPNSSAMANGTTVRFDAAGEYIFQVSVTDGLSIVTSSVSVTVEQTPTSARITPGVFQLAVRSQRQLSASGYDQFGDLLIPQPEFLWQMDTGLGGITSGGLYSAGDAVGTTAVRASAGAITATAAGSVWDVTLDMADVGAVAEPGTFVGLLSGMRDNAALTLIDADGGQFALLGNSVVVGSQPLALGEQNIVVRESVPGHETLNYSLTIDVRSSVSVNTGTDPAYLNAFEAWIGNSVGYVQGIIDGSSWTAFTASPSFVASQYGGKNLPINWAIPLITTGSTLAAAAAGSYDAYWNSVAVSVANMRPNDAAIYVRVGWEFNGNWFPWSAVGQEANYVAAFQRFVTTFRAVSGRFRFDWCPNIGTNSPGEENPELSYPGDAYVDVIGIDFYWMTQFEGTDPTAAWTSMVNRRYGLQWQSDFAAAHHKATAVDEWGIDSDSPSYIFAAASWFGSNHMLWNTYWEQPNDPDCLQDGTKPNAGAAYRQSFAM